MDLQTLINNTNYDHSRKVSQISEMMARKAGYSEKESRIIAQTALYHDIGKSEVPPYIFGKSASLTSEEYETVKTHTTIGYKRLNEAAQILALAAVVASNHHEHIDGCGYPYGVSGSEIHQYGKLVACADVMDALYSRRAYKEPWDIPQIKEYFMARSGKQFDPTMVNVLFSIMDDILKIYNETGEMKNGRTQNKKTESAFNPQQTGI